MARFSNLTMRQYSIEQEQEQENMLKDMDFYHLQENIKIGYRNRLFKNCFQKSIP